MAEGVDYTGVERLAIALGAGNDTFTVLSTHVFDDAGGLVLEGRGGADNLRLRTTSTPTRIAGDGFDPEVTYGTGNRVLSTGTGADTVVDRLARARHGGVLGGIDALVELEGAGADDTLIVDDTGTLTNRIGYLDARTIGGLGMELGAYGTRPDRVEVVAIADVVDGRFTITVGGQTTAALDFDAAATTVRAALEALANIAPGEVEVVRTGGHYVITFRGALGSAAGWALGALAATDVSLVAAAGQVKSIGATPMTQGRISYLEFEHVIVGLGGGDDVLGIDSTHAGTTVVNAGAGDDRLTIETVAGATAVNAEAGDDVILVNAHVPGRGRAARAAGDHRSARARRRRRRRCHHDQPLRERGRRDRRARLDRRRRVEPAHDQRHALRRHLPAARRADRAAQRPGPAQGCPTRSGTAPSASPTARRSTPA